ncbi:MAG TPA: hypothetical protein VIH61_09440 [Waddliaceae bacterium]
MKIIDAGHKYQLDNFEETGFQDLNFIKKEPVSEGSTELKTVQSGTTNEEVLAVLIDRLQFLNTKFPCRENSIVITKLEEALMWLEKRTAGRKIRGVEGKQIK